MYELGSNKLRKGFEIFKQPTYKKNDQLVDPRKYAFQL